VSSAFKQNFENRIMKNSILGTRIDTSNYVSASKSILDWGQKKESRYVCVANVHMVMEAYDSPDFRNAVNAADLVVPDGMPLVWTLRRLGYAGQERVYGPELTLRLLSAAAEKEVPIGFLGGTQETIEMLVKNVQQRFPALQIAYRFSLPFRPISVDEEELIVKEIKSSGVGILFVGLGCPKQERWMAERKGRIRAAMVGVGAAFDFIAGTKRQAPKWMQPIGLEWLFRFSQEPGRLWRRYMYHNPRFIALVMIPLLFRHSPQSPSL
jgi:N-acetylglucosaminyldiphosphoundecaprenol N-acetyl-beta-D-mannosaminyltransferase